MVLKKIIKIRKLEDDNFMNSSLNQRIIAQAKSLRGSSPQLIKFNLGGQKHT